MTDYISRADAIEAVCRTRCGDKAKGCPAHSCLVIEEFDAIPSADAEFADLPDIPRAYYERIVGNMAHEINMLKEQLESADAVQGEWEFVDNEIFAGEYFCSICGKRAEVDLYGEWILSNYCGHCGARMKGGADE